MWTFTTNLKLIGYTSEKDHSETNLSGGNQSSHCLKCFPFRKGDDENELFLGNVRMLSFA